MIVDDSPVIRSVGGRIIGDLGFSVVEAADGFEALEKCRREMPDVILVDWDLTSMSGLELIEELNKNLASQHTKILYCTTEIMIPEMTKAKRAGVNGFLMKPFNREIVIHKLVEAGIIDAAEVAA
ncbi:MAG: response regulator [Pseudomonadota bacterium]